MICKRCGETVAEGTHYCQCCGNDMFDQTVAAPGLNDEKTVAAPDSCRTEYDATAAATPPAKQADCDEPTVISPAVEQVGCDERTVVAYEQRPAYVPPAESKMPKKQNKGIIIGFAVLSLIAVAAIIVAVLFGTGIISKDKKEEKESDSSKNIIVDSSTTAYSEKNEEKEDHKEDHKVINNPVSDVKLVDIQLTHEEYAFGVDKAQPELLDQANAFIKEIKRNGKLAEICNNYFGDGTPVAVKSAKLDTSKDQLVVATNAAYEPFEYTPNGGEDYYGVDMELAAAFAEYLGKELVIQNMDFNSVCISVGQQQCDIAIAGLTINAERKEHVVFSDPYYSASQKIIVTGDNTDFDSCKTAEDVEKKLNSYGDDIKIGVQTGATGQFYVEGDVGWGFKGFSAKCEGYERSLLAVQDLVNGDIDCVVVDSTPAAYVTERINEDSLFQ